MKLIALFSRVVCAILFIKSSERRNLIIPIDFTQSTVYKNSHFDPRSEV